MKRYKIILILIPLFACSCVYLRSPKITIINLSSSDMEDVTVSGNGFQELFTQIKSGESITFRVQPNGESDIKLEFRSKSKMIVKDDLAYLEPGDGSHTTLTIKPTLDVETKAERRLL